MPTNLYGPGDNYHPQNSHVMASLLKKFSDAKKQSSSSVICWGTGSPFREFMHVDDLGESVVFALENWDPSAKNAPLDDYEEPLTYLNVGTGKEIRIFDLANKISQLVGYKGEIIWDHSKPDGTYRKLLNTNKLNKLGWSSKINLNDGIKRTLSELSK